MSKSTRFVLVIGATGQQGGSVIDALLKNGHRVRGLTRHPDSDRARSLASRGVEVVRGDFSDPDSLIRAAEGVDTIFGMTTPFEGGVDVETQQGLLLFDAARKAGVGHFVFSSVASADQATGIPHFDSKYAVEEAIEASGIPYTVIAPVFFMDNLTSPWFAPSIAEGNVALAMPGSTPLQQIAVADIGAFAAVVIQRRDAVFGKRFDIAGDELTGETAARVLSDVLNRDIGYYGFSPDAMREQNEDFAIMFDWFESTGYSADIERLRRDFPEVGWQDFRTWAKTHDWSAVEPVASS